MAVFTGDSDERQIAAVKRGIFPPLTGEAGERSLEQRGEVRSRKCLID